MNEPLDGMSQNLKNVEDTNCGYSHRKYDTHKRTEERDRSNNHVTPRKFA